MSGFYDEDGRFRSTKPESARTPKEVLLAQLQIIRDNLCVANARELVGQGSNWASGYGAGVEAFWEAAEDAVKALDWGGSNSPHDQETRSGG